MMVDLSQMDRNQMRKEKMLNVPRHVNCYIPQSVYFFNETKEHLNWSFAQELFLPHFVFDFGDGSVDWCHCMTCRAVGGFEMSCIWIL